MPTKLDLQPLDLQPIGEQPKLDLQPLDLQPLDATSPEQQISTEKPKVDASDIREGEKGDLFSTKAITDSEIFKISEATGADPEYIRNMVPWMAGKAEDETKGEKVKSLAAWVTNAVGLGVPLKLVKMAQTPENEAALDVLQDLARQKQAYAMDALEFAVPGAGVGLAAKGIGKAVSFLPKAARTIVAPAATGSAIGSVAGFGGSKAGEETSGITTGAAIGGVLGGALPAVKVLKAFQNNPDDINLYQNLVDINLSQKKDVIDNGINAIKKNEVTPEVEKFLKEIKSTNNQIHTIEDAKKFYNEQDLAEQFTDMVKRDVKGEIGKDLAPKFRDKDFTKFDRLVGFISRSQPVLQKIDNETKGLTNLSMTVDKISEKRNQLSQDLANWEKKVDNYFKGKDEKYQFDLTRSLRSKQPVGNVKPEDMQKFVDEVAEPMRNWFKEATGITIDKQDFYIPRLRRQSDDYILALGRQRKKIIDETGADIFGASNSELAKSLPELLQNQGYKDLVKEIALREGKDEAALLNNPALVKTSFADMIHDINSKTKSDVTPFFLKERTGEIPEFALETDPKLLLSRWLKGAVDSHIRPELRELDNAAQVLDKLGAKNMSAFVTRLRDGIVMGGAIDNKTGYNINKLEKLVKNAGTNEKARQGLAKTAVGILDDFSEMVYGGLGKVDSAALNILSPLTTSIPEIGAEYTGILGSRMIKGGMLEALKGVPMENKLRSPAIAKKYGKQLGDTMELSGTDLLENEGIMEHRWIGEARGNFEGGLEKAGVRKALEKYKSSVLPASMIMFTAAEKAARLAMLGMSKSISSDLFSKGYANRLATEMVDNISDVSYKRAIQSAVKRGDKAETQSLLSRYMNSKHMLHYDRPHMSEYGRAVGPMFRMFTTWPSEMAGKAWFQGVKGEGAERQKLLEQYVWPYALLKAAQTEYAEDESGTSIMGNKTPTSLAPMSSLEQMKKALSPESHLPPGYKIPIDTAMAVGKYATEPDAKKGQKNFKNAMDSVGNQFLHMAVPLNGQFFVETLPKMLGSYEKPDKGEKVNRFIGDRAKIFNQLGIQLDTALDNVLNSDNNPEQGEKK